jgi:hypothetical protein
MNDTVSIKKCSQHCSYPRFLHSHFLNFFEHFMPFKHTCSGKYSPMCTVFNIWNVSVAVFFNFTENLITALFHFETFNMTKKTNFTKTTVILICINQTSWNLYTI